MRYELLLQPRIAGTRFDLPAVEKVLADKALTQAPSGIRQWQLPEGTVEVSLVREGDSVVSVALGVLLSESATLVLACVREGLAVAQAAEVSLVDPQLGSPLNAASEGLVEAEFLKAARYAGEFGGISEALGASFRADDERMPVSTRLLLALVVFLVMAILAYRAVS